MTPHSSNLKSDSLLRRRFKPYQLQFLALGAAIGSGLFVGSAQALHAAGPSLLIAYALCALPIYIVARCLGEMTLAFPEDETFVDQVRRQLGRPAGFVTGWGFWAAQVLIGMAELTAIGLLGQTIAPGAPHGAMIVIALAALLMINLSSVQLFGMSEVWMSSIKLAAISGFILLGLVAVWAPGLLGLKDARLSNLWSPGGIFPNGWRAFAHTLPMALFAFGGFEMVSLASAETANPVRAIPQAINGLILRFVIFYLGATSALLVLLPWKEMTPGTSPFVVILQRLHVPGAALLLDGLLITAVLSSCNAVIFGGARTLRSLARSGAAPAGLGRLNRAGIPMAAVVVTAAAISLAVALNIAVPSAVFSLLMAAVSLITVVNWALIVLAELAFRRRRGPTALPRFAVPWTPWANVLVLIFTVAVFAISLIR